MRHVIIIDRNPKGDPDGTTRHLDFSTVPASRSQDLLSKEAESTLWNEGEVTFNGRHYELVSVNIQEETQ